MIKILKYKLYAHDRTSRLHCQIHLAATLYNHCIALHRRYYRWYGQSLDLFKLQKHITKLKKRAPYRHWKTLHSQVIQDITERIDKSYKLFFRNLKHGIKTAPPGFKKSRKYHSITFKQSGWGLVSNHQIRIGKDLYKFSESRSIEGKSDYGFAEFVAILKYQAAHYGCQLTFIERWFPSSKSGSQCGNVNNALILKDREWDCPPGGAHHNRDRNAAINIVTVGSSTGWEEPVRPSASGVAR